MTEHEVRDGLIKIRFSGELLAAVSTETTVQPRWIELELYRVSRAPAGYEGLYYLHTVGRSVVFHARESSCNTGIPTPVGELPIDGEPCPRCRPPLRRERDPRSTDPEDVFWVAAGGITHLDLESDRHTLHVCRDGKEVLVKLTRSSAGGAGKLSAPAQRLLEIAAQADGDIADAIDVTETF